MEWTQDHDLMLLRETAFEIKVCRKAEISEGEVKYKEKNKKDEASSETSTQMSEFDRLLEDITEKEKDSDESRNAAAAKKDITKTEKRQKALERQLWKG